MEKETFLTSLLYNQGLYRDDFRVTGYEFGKGKKSVCIVGAMRGNEVQQHANTSVFKLVKA